MIINDLEKIRELLTIKSTAHQEEILNIVLKSGALINDQFITIDGKYSNYLLRYSQIGWSKYNNRLIEILADTFLKEKCYLYNKNTVILAPETAGSHIAISLAKLWSCKLAILKVRANKQLTKDFRLGNIEPGQEVIAIDDIEQTGSHFEKFKNIVGEKNGKFIGSLAFLSKAGNETSSVYLAKANWKEYSNQEDVNFDRNIQLLFEREFN